MGAGSGAATRCPLGLWPKVRTLIDRQFSRLRSIVAGSCGTGVPIIFDSPCSDSMRMAMPQPSINPCRAHCRSLTAVVQVISHSDKCESSLVPLR